MFAKVIYNSKFRKKNTPIYLFLKETSAVPTITIPSRVVPSRGNRTFGSILSRQSTLEVIDEDPEAEVEIDSLPSLMDTQTMANSLMGPLR